MWTERSNPIAAVLSGLRLQPATGRPEEGKQHTDTYSYDPSLLRVYDDHTLFVKPEPHALLDFVAWLIKRLKIALCALPFVGAMLLLRWLLWMDPKSPLVAPIDSIVVAPVITCVVFVMSTVYGNVISDYKESEKIPAELVAYFQNLATFAVSEARARHFDHRPMCAQIELMLLPLLSTLDKHGDQ